MADPGTFTATVCVCGAPPAKAVNESEAGFTVRPVTGALRFRVRNTVVLADPDWNCSPALYFPWLIRFAGLTVIVKVCVPTKLHAKDGEGEPVHIADLSRRREA